MLPINDTITLLESELTWSYARSSGPGGQNVNKVASKALLRWHLAASTSVPDEVKARLARLERKRITTEGDLLVVSQRYRDQERNRQDCLDRLRELVLHALEVPKPRKATRPTRGSKRRRLADKRHRAETKQRRQGSGDE